MATPASLADHLLHLACHAGAEREVRTLLRGGADCDGQVSDDAAEARRRGTTPLIVAARGGHLGTINILFEAGTRVDLAKADGSAPLLMAAAGKLELETTNVPGTAANCICRCSFRLLRTFQTISIGFRSV